MFKKTIKHVFFAILIALAVSLIFELISDTPACVLKKLNRKAAINSDSLNLRANYLLIIPVGEARLNNLGIEKFRNRDLIHIRAEANTFDFVKSIFYAKATVDSYIDPKELDSVYFLQHLEMINKPNEDKEIFYDQKKHIMIYQGSRGREERVIAENARDPLAAIFYLQNKQFELGGEFLLNTNTNQKNYVISGKISKKETVKAGNKDYAVWLVEASVARKDKNPRHKSRFKIWFLENNGQKLPILIKAMTNIGPIVAKAE